MSQFHQFVQPSPSGLCSLDAKPTFHVTSRQNLIKMIINILATHLLDKTIYLLRRHYVLIDKLEANLQLFLIRCTKTAFQN